MRTKDLTHELDDDESAARQERRRTDMFDDASGTDGPEFSSEPMPAAYGVVFSAAVGVALGVLAILIL